MFPLRDTIPSRRTPFVLWLLLLANGLAFLYELKQSPTALATLFERFGVVPASLGLSPRAFLAAPERYASLVTSMFLHGGWLHLLANLWTLAIFGDNVEDRMGKTRFLVFYLLCGVLAGVVHVHFHPDSSVPTVGASGAISGVMGAYFVLYPRAKIITLVLLIFYPLFVELPAFVFLGVWFAAQLLSEAAGRVDHPDSGGIAFLAHVGGFVAGLLLHRIFVRPRR